MDAELIGNRRFNLNKCSSVKDMKIVHVQTVHSLPQVFFFKHVSNNGIFFSSCLYLALYIESIAK